MFGIVPDADLLQDKPHGHGLVMGPGRYEVHTPASSLYPSSLLQALSLNPGRSYEGLSLSLLWPCLPSFAFIRLSHQSPFLSPPPSSCGSFSLELWQFLDYLRFGGGLQLVTMGTIVTLAHFFNRE